MKVLLVDDNEINLEIQKMMLESCGLEVITADNGKSAVELVKLQDFSMIFMDIHMPEMDGYTACEKIREFNRSVPVVALSADVPRDDRRFKSSHMSGFLTKPLEIDSLRSLLEKFMSVDSSEIVRGGGDSVFDYDSLISVMKDEKSAFRLIKQFLSIHNRDCELLTERIQEGNFAGAREILHNVTGISGNMFCKRLYSVSCALRNELRENRAESLGNFTEIWEATYSELEKFYKRLAEKYPSFEYHADWKTLWENFIALSYAFDISAVDIFTENIQTFMANMDATDFKNLKKAILNYDFLWISDNL